jgi:hypothetical protein
LFEELFIKGIPPFWDGKGKLYDQEEYNALLTQCRMDHSKFETLEGKYERIYISLASYYRL